MSLKQTKEDLLWDAAKLAAASYVQNSNKGSVSKTNISENSSERQQSPANKQMICAPEESIHGTDNVKERGERRPKFKVTHSRIGCHTCTMDENDAEETFRKSVNIDSDKERKMKKKSLSKFKFWSRKSKCTAKTFENTDDLVKQRALVDSCTLMKKNDNQTNGARKSPVFEKSDKDRLLVYHSLKYYRKSETFGSMYMM